VSDTGSGTDPGTASDTVSDTHPGTRPDTVSDPRFSTEPQGGAGREQIQDGGDPQPQETPPTVAGERRATSIAKRLGHRDRVGSPKGAWIKHQQRPIADDRRTHGEGVGAHVIDPLSSRRDRAR